MALSADQHAGPRSLADRLADVHVALRADLDVSRHVFRGQAAYIIRDPVSFQSHRFSAADYRLLVALHEDRPLRDTCRETLGDDADDPERRERFYSFIVSLHRLNLLRLPISDDKTLYDRFRAKRRARNRERALGIFFLRVPLWNPDAFLDRTIDLIRPLFTRTAVAVWAAAVLTAILVALSRADELANPINGLFTARNLPALWAILIALKVIHEFAHAYTTKHFGGRVPEMGLMLVALTPLAYVDATDSWGFSRARHRIIVAIAGMVAEAFIASLAVIAWAFMPPSPARDVAWQTAMLASVVTIGFNINPLMKFDGYYILCDLLGIPNLRARASHRLAAIAGRLVLGTRDRHAESSIAMSAFLAAFGLATALYRSAVIIGIAALVATRFPTVGLALAGCYIVIVLIGLTLRTARYLLSSHHTAPVRRRARIAGAALALGVPALVALLPIPRAVVASGAVEHAEVQTVRTRHEGFLRHARVRPGDTVTPDQPLAAIDNSEIDARADQAHATLERALQRAANHAGLDRDAELAALHRADHERRILDHRLEQRSQLTPAAPAAGTVLDAVDDRQAGQWIAEGHVIATIGSGGYRTRLLLSEEQFALVRPHPGQVVSARTTARPDQTLHAVVRSVAPTASRRVEPELLAADAGGPIPVDPQTGNAGRPYVLVELDLTTDTPHELRSGMSIHVRWDAPPATLAHITRVAVERFVMRLSTNH